MIATDGILAVHRPTWMLADGQPGEVLRALHAASGAQIAKRKQGDLSWTSIDEIRAVASRACKEHGLVVLPVMGEYRIGGADKAPLAEATVHLRFVSVADGSYVTATVTGAGRAGMGRSLTVAVTAAVKQALATVLGIADPEGVDATAQPWTPDQASDAAEEWYGRIRAATTLEQLQAAVPLQEQRYTEEELAHGRQVYRGELDRLRSCVFVGDVESTVRWKRAKDRARERGQE